MPRVQQPELFSLRLTDWQFFCTFTFKKAEMPERVRVAMFFALLRIQAGNFGVHFKRLLWALRREHGEAFGRYHFHALIAGLPCSAESVSTCFSFMKIWERVGGGQARVTLYDSTLDGVEYILKAGEQLAASLAARKAGDYHELNKFGGSCDVMLSESLCRRIQNRFQLGQRGRGTNADKTGGTDTPSTLGEAKQDELLLSGQGADDSGTHRHLSTRG